MGNGLSARRDRRQPLTPSSTEAPMDHGAGRVDTGDKGFSAAADFYVDRPAHSGKWFIIHKSHRAEFEFEEACDIWAQFFAVHPNASEYLKQFEAVKLCDDQIVKQRNRIRLSSYKWEDVKGVSCGGVDKFAIPSNYTWFLQVLEKYHYIGWMDFMANVVVNVPTGETVDYMGELYSQSVVIADWMFDTSKLSPAMSRAWIFQEMTFGAMDESGVMSLLSKVRELGQQVRTGDVDCLLNQFVPLANAFGELLLRRGYENVVAQRGGDTLRTFKVYARGYRSRVARQVADQLVRRLGGACEYVANDADEIKTWKRDNYHADWDLFDSIVQLLHKQVIPRGSQPAVHLLDYYTLPAGQQGENTNVMEPYVLELLLGPAYAGCADFDRVKKQFGQSLVLAYASCAATFEIDRDDAITQVARSVSRSFGEVLNAEAMLAAAWRGWAASCVEVGEGRATFSVPFFQPTIPAGRRLLGLEPLHGSKMTRASDGWSWYEDENGEAYYPGKDLGVGVFESQLGLLPRDKDTFTLLADKSVVEVFACAGPACVPEMLFTFVARRLESPPDEPAALAAWVKERTAGHWPKPAKKVTFA
uniref:Uncharacterized protein n=1 Tax=Chrysotila carterae TaxID=13221 RepID=A0A7S4C495_CHRCT